MWEVKTLEKVRKYIKQIVPVEAVQYNDESIKEWIGERAVISYVDELCITASPTDKRIIASCNKGDYVVKEEELDYYTVKKDYFEKAYEPYDESKENEQISTLIHNLVMIMDITKPHLENKDLELIHTIANDSICRLEEMAHYPNTKENGEK